MNDEYDLEDIAPWVAVFITLVGVGLRVLLLDKQGMWMDETFSLWMTNHSLGELLQWTARIDYHPPLYYLLLRGWTALNGDAAYNVRFLSVLFGAGTIPIVYLIGKRMSGSLVGLAAALFMALSPFNIRYSQEARMYALLTFNASVAMYALVRLLTDPCSRKPIGSQFKEYLRAWGTKETIDPDNRADFTYKITTGRQPAWRAWISRHSWLPVQAIETDLTWTAFIVFSAATLLSHNTAVLFFAAANLFVFSLLLFQRAKKPTAPTGFQAPSVGNWIKAQAGILLLWSPWSVAFFRQAGRVYREFSIPPPNWDVVLQSFKSLLNESMLNPTTQVSILLFLYLPVLCLGLWRYKKEISKAAFLAALFAVPFLGELIVSTSRPVFLDKTLIWISIPLFLLLAAGVAQLRYGFLVLGVLGLFCTLNFMSVGDYYRWSQKEDWSLPAGFVANFAQKDDLILFNASRTQIPFDYYFVSYEGQYSLDVEKHGVPVDLFASGVLEPKMTESDIAGLVSLLGEHPRVWLVYGYQWNTDSNGLVLKTLGEEMKLVNERDYPWVRIYLFDNNSLFP